MKTHRPSSPLQHTPQSTLSASPACASGTSTPCVAARYATLYTSIANAVMNDGGCPSDAGAGAAAVRARVGEGGGRMYDSVIRCAASGACACAAAGAAADAERWRGCFWKYLGRQR